MRRPRIWSDRFTEAQRLPGLLAALALALICGLSPASAAHAAPPSSPLIKIGDARTLPLGSTITVQGSVTVPSGAYSSSAGDEGFAIQDQSGGIYVSIATNLGLELRSKIRVTGQLADSNGLLILVVSSPSDVKPLGNGPAVQPQPVATGAVNEATEGLLVSVAGAITEPVINDLPYGYYLAVDDGSGAIRIYIPESTGIDVSGLAVGQQIHVVGLSYQFADHYEIDPRLPGDITLQ
ncbi:MAG: hypothetical protein R3C14_45430 [Caldilineaceae bacterium]